MTLFITPKDSVMDDWFEIVAQFSDSRNRLANLYPNNPEIAQLHREVIITESDIVDKNKYRIKGRNVVIKPQIDLLLDRNSITAGEQVNLTISVSDLVEGEVIPEIEFCINGIADTEVLINNAVIIPLTFNDPMQVVISVGKHYRSVPAKLEVMPIA